MHLIATINANDNNNNNIPFQNNQPLANENSKSNNNNKNVETIYRHLDIQNHQHNIKFLNTLQTILRDEKYHKYTNDNNNNLYKRIENRAIESNEARADDKEEILKNRLNIYDEQTKPLVPYYKKAELHYEVDGMKSIDEISLEIEKILKI